MSVLITGSAGQVGAMLRARLPQRGWVLRHLDRVPLPPGTEGRVVVGDVNDPEALREAFEPVGADRVEAVVHLGGQPTEAPWADVRAANIDGTHAMFEAARRYGVRRVVFASSNHAVGFTPRRDADLPDDTEARPDTLYGVSKIFGEALGRYYADRYGLAVACLRIGSCTEHPDTHRALATWLSPDDAAGLVDAALRKPDLHFATVWAVSANRDRWWSQRGATELGYTPVDDAAAVHPDLAERPAQPFEHLVGGEYTTARYGIDEVAGR